MASTGVSRIEGINPFVAFKAPCKAATTANITLSGAQTIDGVAVAETTPKTRVLVRAQTDATENGIYDVMDTAWVRSDDFNGTRDAVEGTLVEVTNGTSYADTTWRVETTGTIVFGTSNITFSVTSTIGTTQPLNYSTVAAATADDTLPIGAVVLVKEYASGKGIINAIYDVVDPNGADGGTDDGFEYHDSDTASLFQLKLRVPTDKVNVKLAGAYGDGSNNDLSAIHAVRDYLLANGGGEVYFPPTSNSYDLGAGTIETTGNSLKFSGPINRSAKITTSNQRVIANDGTTARTYIEVKSLYLSTTTNSARALDFTYWKKFEISNNIVEVVGSNCSCIYGIGTSAGSSPYYGVMTNNDLAPTGAASGTTRGYHFDGDSFSGGATIRGPNSIVVTGGRVANCKESIAVVVGNNNTFTGVASEAVVSGGYDVVLGQSSGEYTGTATAGASSSLTDSGANFGSNLANGGIKITGGTGNGQIRKIESASSTVVSIKNPWATVPDGTSTYEIFPADAIGNTFVNIRSEGTTNKAGAFRRRAGAYQTDILGTHVSSLGSGVLIDEDQFDFSDINNFGGLKEAVPYTFFQDNVSASQSGVQIPNVGASSSVEYMLPIDGEIVAITIFSTQARSGGTLTVVPSVNGVAVSNLSAVLDATRDQDNIQVAPYGDNSLGGRNKRLGVEITTDGSWAPTTADITVQVWVLPRN